MNIAVLRISIFIVDLTSQPKAKEKEKESIIKKHLNSLSEEAASQTKTVNLGQRRELQEISTLMSNTTDGMIVRLISGYNKHSFSTLLAVIKNILADKGFKSPVMEGDAKIYFSMQKSLRI